MQTDTITLRELTIRYSVKADATGQPVVIGRTLSTPAVSAAALAALLQDEPGEVFAILCLSTKHRVIAYHEVSRGTLDATLVHPRLCWAAHKRGYVAAVLMWRSRVKTSDKPAFHGPRTPHNRIAFARSIDTAHAHNARRKAMSPGSFLQCLRAPSGIAHTPSALAFIARSTSA